MAKLLNGCDISAQVFRTLACEDVYKVSLVQQCHSFGQLFGTNYLQLCLGNPSEACSIINKAKIGILAKDWEHTVNQTNTHPTLAIISGVAKGGPGWARAGQNILFVPARYCHTISCEVRASVGLMD